MPLPTDIHGTFDAIQSIVLIGGLIFFVYDRLKLTTTHSEQIRDLNESIGELTKTVSNLAVSVGHLQGKVEMLSSR